LAGNKKKTPVSITLILGEKPGGDRLGRLRRRPADGWSLDIFSRPQKAIPKGCALVKLKSAWRA
jgi:hypothetical protein